MPQNVNLKINYDPGTSFTPLDPRQNVLVKSVSAGGHHTLFLSEDGYVFSCGSGSNGQLGHKSTKNQYVPKLVYSLTNK